MKSSKKKKTKIKPKSESLGNEMDQAEEIIPQTEDKVCKFSHSHSDMREEKNEENIECLQYTIKRLTL